MAQNGDDGRDQIDESQEPFSLEELIREAEESGGFEEFLNRTSNRGGKWSKTEPSQTTGVDAAAQHSESSGSVKVATDSSAPSSVQSVTDPRVEALKNPNYIQDGFSKSQQDKRAAGEVPEPAIPPSEVPEPPKPAVEEAQVAITEVTVHHHPIVGYYSSANTHRTEEDDEMRATHLNALNKGVNEMTWQEIQDVIHRIERRIVLENRAQQGFREALEIHLMKMNMGERAQMLERDAEIRRKTKPKSASSGVAKKKVSTSGKVVGVSSSDRKAADALFKMGFELDECLERLKKDGKDMTNKEYLAFIKKLYGGV